MDKKVLKRCVILSLVLVTGLSALSFRLVYLQVIDRDIYIKKAQGAYAKKDVLQAKRGTIIDCNGEVIARSVISKSIVVDKYHLREPRTVVKALAAAELSKTAKWYEWTDKRRNKEVQMRGRKLLNQSKDRSWIIKDHLDYATRILARPLRMTEEELRDKIDIDGKKDREVIFKNLPTDLASRLEELIKEKRIKGFKFEETIRRSYSSPSLLTHTLGHTDIEGTGKAGVEKAMNEYLAGIDGFKIEHRDPSGEIMPAQKGSIKRPINGHSVQLTIDMGIQAIIEEELQKGMDEFDAVRGTIVVMDPHTGNILAVASRPHYNLSTREDIIENGFNYALLGQYEPGSTFKVIAAASALNEGLVGYDTVIDCHWGVLQENGFKVTDDFPKGKLKFWEIQKKSNNIGTWKMAKMVGYRGYMNYVKSFGFGEKAGILVGSEARGSIRDNGNMMDFSRKSYGYNVMVSPLQIANAYCVLANGGNLMQPNIVKRVEGSMGEVIQEYKPTIKRRVISERTATTMRKALKTVIEEGGTATRADVAGYTEGGKTGTAIKWDPKMINPNNGKLGWYNKKKKVVSFAGMMPIEHPKFVCVVVIDEPRAEKDFNLGGGTVAAPIWREASKRIAAHMNLEPTEPVEPTLTVTE